jgi:bifunctional non-homologous end joining protein LigD
MSCRQAANVGPPALSLLHAVACDEDGVASFNRVRYRHHDESIFLYAFDLIELNGDDLRPDPLEGRKATLEMILEHAY